MKEHDSNREGANLEHIFTVEEENLALQLLDSIDTACEAIDILLDYAAKRDFNMFMRLAGDLKDLITGIRAAAELFHRKKEQITLPVTCECALFSLQSACNALPADWNKAEMKLRFELQTGLDEAYMRFYYHAYVSSHPEREKLYYDQEVYELASNRFVNQALETGAFRHEVSFVITAYNHLDYTRMCVEGLLQNIPDGLDYELILFDNGSSDATEAFFESVHPDKLLHAKVNYGYGMFFVRAVESKYVLSISNDVIILPGAIENMLSCMRSAEDIARVVPTTPNVSNLQMIAASYNDREEMDAFARRNNVFNPYRWEQRTRLCDPLALDNMALCYSRKGLCSNGYLTDGINSFPDDRIAMFCRRRGYKMYLAKDSYCHHFGSVTIKDDVTRQNEAKYYAEGRIKFMAQFGIDPWGTGFCYDPAFLDRVVGEHTAHTEVLGINCGMGSNSLKIKEQIKEHCHNTDCILTNVTDDERYIPELTGVSDSAVLVRKIKQFKQLLQGRSFDYIVWDAPFLIQYEYSVLIELCKKHLTSRGKLFFRQSPQLKEYQPETGVIPLGGEWFALSKTI